MVREIKKVVRTAGSGWKFLLLLVLRMPFSIMSTIVNAVFLRYAFNATEANDTQGLIWICALFGAANLFLFFYNGAVWSIYAPFTTRLEARLRIKLFNKILSFSCERIEETSSGEWLTRLNTDVEMPFSRPLHLPHAVGAIVNIGVSAIILLNSNAAIFAMVMLFVIPHILISQIMIARAMPGLNKKSLETLAENTGSLTELITCADVAAIYDCHAYFMNRFEQSSLRLIKANMKIHAKNALGAGILPLFGIGGYLALLTVSAGWIADGALTFGDLTAAFQYRGGVLVGSMMLISSLISIQASMAGIKRLNAAMDE